jgi:hypothetical protein
MNDIPRQFLTVKVTESFFAFCAKEAVRPAAAAIALAIAGASAHPIVPGDQSD